MCTGLEIAALVGAGTAAASATGVIGPKGDGPTVLRESPKADADKAAADAASKAGADKLATKRRRAAASLLATGGQGDTSSPVTGLPAATGKATLGS